MVAPMRLTIFCAIAAATGVVSGASSECYSASAPADTDFIACLFCNNAKFAHFAKTLNSTATSALCEAASHNVASDSRFIAQVLAEYGEVMAGVYWRNDTEAHQALAHLVQFMPRRDAALLLDGDDSFLHFLFEHVRCLSTRQPLMCCNGISPLAPDARPCLSPFTDNPVARYALLARGGFLRDIPDDVTLPLTLAPSPFPG